MEACRSKRVIRHVVGGITALAVAAMGPQAIAQAQRRTTAPNIVFLMADDMGYGDLGVYNPASKIPTPNMDRLASAGIRFSDAHSSAARCTPSRYGILTGRYASRTGRLGNLGLADPLIEPGRMTIASMLQARGYRTAAIGKWHLGLNLRAENNGRFVRAARGEVPANVDWSAPVEGGPLDYGFDYYFGNPGVARIHAFVENRHFDQVPRLNAAGTQLIAPGWSHNNAETTQLNKALAFITQHHAMNQNQSEDDPFFLYLASSAPHLPYNPPGQMNGVPVRGVSDAGKRGDEVVQVDVILGQLLQKLEALGLADDTLFVVTSAATRKFRYTPTIRIQLVL